MAVPSPRRREGGSPAAEVPIACTLEAAALPDRLHEWRALLARARSRAPLPGGAVRIEFDADAPVDRLARIVVAEQQCCAFFSFAITVDQRGLGLEVQAPAGTEEILSSLFGTSGSVSSLRNDRD